MLGGGVEHSPVEQVVEQSLLVLQGLGDVGGDAVWPELPELGQDLKALSVGQVHVTDDLQKNVKYVWKL